MRTYGTWLSDLLTKLDIEETEANHDRLRILALVKETGTKQQRNK